MNDFIYVPQYGFGTICDFDSFDGYEEKSAAKDALLAWARNTLRNQPRSLGSYTLDHVINKIAAEIEETGSARWRADEDSIYPALVFRIAKVAIHSKEETTRYYGVEQSCHGHVYRWIFDEETVSREMFGGGNVPSDICLDTCWPIGGSNSSSTWVMLLDGENEIAGFLSGTPGCEHEDPALCDIAEFYKTVDCDRGSCTAYWLQKLGLTEEECETEDDSEGHRKKAEKMIDALKTFESSVNHLRYPKYDDLYFLDYRNPFYGLSRDMRFSELEELYKRYCEEKTSAIDA